MRRPPSPAGAATWVFLLACAALMLGGCRGEAPVQTTAFIAFGASADLRLVGVEDAAAEAITDEIQRDFAFMDTRWRSGQSDTLARVNEALAAGKSVAAPPSILPLVRLAQRYAEQSGGLLNLATGRLAALWGFHAASQQGGPPPSAAAIRELIEAAPQMSDLVIDGLELRSTNPTAQLDLDPIASGYGIDLAIDYLREQGVRHALLRVGNGLRAIGDRAGKPWRVVVPRPSGSGVYGTVEISGDESVVTVGDYERSFLYAGETYHAILDPRTGYPADGAQAVTVIDEDAATAAAAARALFIAGPDRWPQVAAAMGVSQALLFDREGTAQMTPDMAARLVRLDEAREVSIRAPAVDVGAEQG